MPLYEYACDRCGHQLEVRQRISEDPLKTCPSCGADALVKLVSRSSFALKGSGWYADGYGAKPAGDKAAEPKPSGDTAAKPADGATKPAEAKPKADAATPAAPAAPATPKSSE